MNRYRTPELAVTLLLMMVTPILLSCSGGDNGATTGRGALYALTAEKSNAMYDLIIKNGRVIDPGTGRDEIVSVGIKNGIIVKIAIWKNSILPNNRGKCEVVDASDLVVSPGFINTHTHEGVFVDTSKAIVQDGITFKDMN